MPVSPPRIPNLPEDQWTEDVQELFPMMVPPGAPWKGSDFNSILVFAHNPKLAKPWLEFSQAQGRDFKLDARYREIATLRVAYRYRNDYEWTHHVFSGSAAGLTPDHYRAIARGSADPIWTEFERHVLDATDQFNTHREIEPATWAGLAAELDHARILELCFVIGSYVMLAWTFNSAGVRLEAGFADKAKAMGYPLLDEV